MNDIERNLEQLYELMDSYKLTKEEQQDFLSLVIDIFNHDEFQLRMSDKFLHHGDITLGL